VVEVPVPPSDPVPQQYFGQLFVTCPDGLSVTYFLESSIGGYFITFVIFRIPFERLSVFNMICIAETM